jgi:hypothetical protein
VIESLIDRNYEVLDLAYAYCYDPEREEGDYDPEDN